MGDLLGLAVRLAKDEEDTDDAEKEKVLGRDDEAGELGRLLVHIAKRKDGSDQPPSGGGQR